MENNSDRLMRVLNHFTKLMESLESTTNVPEEKLKSMTIKRISKIIRRRSLSFPTYRNYIINVCTQLFSKYIGYDSYSIIVNYVEFNKDVSIAFTMDNSTNIFIKMDRQYIKALDYRKMNIKYRGRKALIISVIDCIKIDDNSSIDKVVLLTTESVQNCESYTLYIYKTKVNDEHFYSVGKDNKKIVNQCNLKIKNRAIERLNL